MELAKTYCFGIFCLQNDACAHTCGHGAARTRRVRRYLGLQGLLPVGSRLSARAAQVAAVRAWDDHQGTVVLCLGCGICAVLGLLKWVLVLGRSWQIHQVLLSLGGQTMATVDVFELVRCSEGVFMGFAWPRFINYSGHFCKSIVRI